MDISTEVENAERQRIFKLITGYTKIVALSMDVMNVICSYRYDFAHEYNTQKCREMVTMVKYFMTVDKILFSHKELENYQKEIRKAAKVLMKA